MAMATSNIIQYTHNRMSFPFSLSNSVRFLEVRSTRRASGGSIVSLRLTAPPVDALTRSASHWHLANVFAFGFWSRLAHTGPWPILCIFQGSFTVIETLYISNLKFHYIWVSMIVSQLSSSSLLLLPSSPSPPPSPQPSARRCHCRDRRCRLHPCLRCGPFVVVVVAVVASVVVIVVTRWSLLSSWRWWCCSGGRGRGGARLRVIVFDGRMQLALAAGGIVGGCPSPLLRCS
jgi:hypothetical protein